MLYRIIFGHIADPMSRPFCNGSQLFGRDHEFGVAFRAKGAAACGPLPPPSERPRACPPPPTRTGPSGAPVHSATNSATRLDVSRKERNGISRAMKDMPNIIRYYRIPDPIPRKTKGIVTIRLILLRGALMVCTAQRSGRQNYVRVRLRALPNGSGEKPLC